MLVIARRLCCITLTELAWPAEAAENSGRAAAGVIRHDPGGSPIRSTRTKSRAADGPGFVNWVLGCFRSRIASEAVARQQWRHARVGSSNVRPRSDYRVDDGQERNETPHQVSTSASKNSHARKTRTKSLPPTGQQPPTHQLHRSSFRSRLAARICIDSSSKEATCEVSSVSAQISHSGQKSAGPSAVALSRSRAEAGRISVDFCSVVHFSMVPRIRADQLESSGQLSIAHHFWKIKAFRHPRTRY